MTIPTESYRALYNQYVQSLKWLEVNGIDISKGRLKKYEAILKELSESFESKNYDKLDNLYLHVLSSATEFQDIIRIFNGLKDLDFDSNPKLSDTLKKAIYGPHYITDETHKNNSGRNYQFELVLCSYLNKPDLGLSFIPNSQSDAAAKFLNKTYLFECKRLHSKNQIEKNVKDAANQLTRRLKTKVGSNYRGIIAIDFSKVYNPDFQLLESGNDESLVNYIQQEVRNIIEQYHNSWQRIICKYNKKIIAVMIRISFMGISKIRNLMVTCSEWGVNPKNNIKDIEFMYLEELTKVINVEK